MFEAKVSSLPEFIGRLSFFYDANILDTYTEMIILIIARLYKKWKSAYYEFLHYNS